MLAANGHPSKRIARGARGSRTTAGRDWKERRLAVAVVDDVSLDGRRATRVRVGAEGVVGKDLVDSLGAQDAVARLGVDNRRLGASRGSIGDYIACRGEGRGASTNPSSTSSSAHAEARDGREGGGILLRVEDAHVLLLQ